MQLFLRLDVVPVQLDAVTGCFSLAPVCVSRSWLRCFGAWAALTSPRSNAQLWLLLPPRCDLFCSSLWQHQGHHQLYRLVQDMRMHQLHLGGAALSTAHYLVPLGSPLICGIYFISLRGMLFSDTSLVLCLVPCGRRRR